MLFFRTAALAALALAASVSAQLPDPTLFTSPVVDGLVYRAGSTQTFSWSQPCMPPSYNLANDPTRVPVYLVNATKKVYAPWLEDITFIDCTKSSGSHQWTVPDRYDNNTVLALSINLRYQVLSATFTISGSKTAPRPTTASPTPTGSAKSLVPVLSSVAAASAAGALYLL